MHQFLVNKHINSNSSIKTAMKADELKHGVYFKVQNTNGLIYLCKYDGIKTINNEDTVYVNWYVSFVNIHGFSAEAHLELIGFCYVNSLKSHNKFLELTDNDINIIQSIESKNSVSKELLNIFAQEAKQYIK